MAITAAKLTSGNSALAGTSFVTASISPGINNLDIVSIDSFFAGTSNVPTVTGAGGTWILIATTTDSTVNKRVTMLRDLSASPGSGALTIDFAGQSAASCQWSVDEFSGIDTTGTHGSGAIVQSVGGAASSATTTGFTVTLAALASANNAAHGSLRNNANGAVTAGAGFTELTNQLSGTTVQEVEWALNKTAVNWTWASETVVSVGLTIEIKAFVALAQTWVTNPYSLMPDPIW